MNEKADQRESKHEQLIKQPVWSHDAVPSHGIERGLLYPIDSRWNYPLCAGTGPRKPPVWRSGKRKNRRSKRAISM